MQTEKKPFDEVECHGTQEKQTSKPFFGLLPRYTLRLTTGLKQKACENWESLIEETAV